MGLSEEEMMDIIQKWRKASPAIVSLWREVEDCAKRAIRTHSPQRLKHGNITFKFSNGILFICLLYTSLGGATATQRLLC